MTMHPDAEDLTHGRTYHRFMLMVKWAAIHLAVVMVFLTVWFATPGGFMGGLVSAVIVAALGIYAMRHGLAHSTEDQVIGFSASDAHAPADTLG